jgi:hypothetical protein
LLYLVGIERPDLLVYIKEPVANLNLQKEEKAEPVKAAI